jgi:hypothetical protein
MPRWRPSDPETTAILEARRRSFHARELLLPGLRKLGFKIAAEPQGAFYVYADSSGLAADSTCSPATAHGGGRRGNPGPRLRQQRAAKPHALCLHDRRERIEEGLRMPAWRDAVAVPLKPSLRPDKKKARAEVTARACYPLGTALSPEGLERSRCYRQGREPVGNGQAAAGFSDDLMPGAAAVEGAAAAAGLQQPSSAAGFFAAGFLAAGFFAAGFLAAGFFAAGFLAAGFFAAGFLAAGFFAAGFLAAGFFAAGFLAAGFFAAGFLAAGFFAAGFLAAGFFAAGFLAAGFFAAGLAAASSAQASSPAASWQQPSSQPASWQPASSGPQTS